MIPTYRVTIDGCDCDLTPAQLSERAKALYAVVQRADDAVLQSAVKLGVLLLQVRGTFKHGSWELWLKANGIHAKRAERSVKLARMYAGPHGHLDEQRVAEAIERYNTACREDERLDPTSRSIRTAERALSNPTRASETADHAEARSLSFVPRVGQMTDDAEDVGGVEEDGEDAIAAALAWGDGDDEGAGDGVDGAEAGLAAGDGHVARAPSIPPPVPDAIPVHTSVGFFRLVPPAPPAAASDPGRGRVPDVTGQAMLADLFAELDARLRDVRDLAGRGVLGAEELREVIAVLERVASARREGGGVACA